jgi:flagellar motor switch protein FliG
MDKTQAAAIIILGLGDAVASEVLKNMSGKEVKSILEAIDNVGKITEEDLLEALDLFMQEINGIAGIDLASKEQFKKSILEESGKYNNNYNWLELIKMQPVSRIAELLQDEHPQIVTAVISCCTNMISSEYGINLLFQLPKSLQSIVIKRMPYISVVTNEAMEFLEKFFERELLKLEMNSSFTLNGIDVLANIISSLDSTSEHQIVNLISSKNKSLGDKIQDQIFPFQRLAELDKKSLQLLLAEIKSEDLVLALKGVDNRVKEIFFESMSIKTVEMLKDELASKGPVKISNVHEAQKRIIKIAKKMDEEERIILTSKNNHTVVF